jgi:hypothetical protein
MKYDIKRRMTEVTVQPKTLLLEGKFQEYLDIQKSIDFEIDDIALCLKCKDIHVLKSLMRGFDLPDHVINTMIKFYIITEEENETLMSLEAEFSPYEEYTLLEMALEQKSISAISWCIQNINPDDELQELFGKEVDNLDETDKSIIEEILESLERDNENNEKPSRKWWRGIVNYSHYWDDIVEDSCPFGPDTLTRSSSSSSSQEEF